MGMWDPVGSGANQGDNYWGRCITDLQSGTLAVLRPGMGLVRLVPIGVVHGNSLLVGLLPFCNYRN